LLHVTDPRGAKKSKEGTIDVSFVNFFSPYLLFIYPAAPPDIERPRLERVTSPTSLLVSLYQGSEEVGFISHYYLVVVPEHLTVDRHPEEFRNEEVR